MTEVLLLILAVAFFARRGRGKGGAPDRWPAVLASAERAGIITESQRAALLAHAATTAAAEPQRLGGVAWLGVLAGLFVVAGVSLLIARNWEAIGAPVRVAGFLALLAAAGEAAIRLRGRTAAVSAPLEIVWFFLPLLGIGLYGQTFQLSGDPIQPFLVWLMLGLPLAWLSERPVVAILHVFALTAVLFVGNYVLEPVAFAFSSATTPALPSPLAITGDAARPLAWVLSGVILVLVAVESLRRLPRDHRHHFVGIWVAWTFCLLVTATPFRLHHEGWLVFGALALVTLWVAVMSALDTSFEERAASIGVWLTMLYGLTFTWHLNEAASGTTTRLGLVVACGAALVAAATVLLSPATRLSPHRGWAFGAKAMTITPLVVATAYLGDDATHVWLAGGVMNVLLVAIAVGLMWHGSLVHEAAQVNLGVLVLIAVLVTRFLDVFGNMFRSGLGFIVAGCLLAALAWALERTRRRLLATPSGGLA
ncbi:MAG: DUF2157 domain-containing protein [Deltaproteobacteria bacterium]|nr:DUF2157 domain-containing protein [Deltaproteobacteria bacterium]